MPVEFEYLDSEMNPMEMPAIAAFNEVVVFNQFKLNSKMVGDFFIL